MDSVIAHSSKSQLTVKDKVCLAGASYLSFFCISLINSVLMKYFTDYIMLPAVIFGTSHLLYGVFSAICNIIVGSMSDNAHSSSGVNKRLLFIRRSVPVMVFGFILWLLADPDSLNSYNTALLVAGMAALAIGITLFGINYASLIINITDDIDERTSIGIWNSFLILIPGLIAGALPAYFFVEGYTFSFVRIVFAVAGLLMTTVTWFCIQRLPEPRIRDQNINQQSHNGFFKTLNSFYRDMISVFHSRSYVVYAAYAFLFTMVSTVYFSNATYYLDNVLAVTGMMAMAVATAGPVLEYISYPCVRVLRNNLGTHKTVCCGLAILSCSYLVMYFSHGYWAFMVFYSLFHIGLAANWLLGAVMLGEIIDEDHLIHGRNRSGLFFGITGVIVVPAGSLMVFLFSAIIDFTGYVPNAEQLTPLAEQGIRFGAMLLPAIISAAALIILYFLFPLKGDYYKQVRQQFHAKYSSDK